MGRMGTPASDSIDGSLASLLRPNIRHLETRSRNLTPEIKGNQIAFANEIAGQPLFRVARDPGPRGAIHTRQHQLVNVRRANHAIHDLGIEALFAEEVSPTSPA